MCLFTLDAAINKFFAGKNENRNKISETWQSVLGGDTCIRLEYAVKDGNGDPFNNGKVGSFEKMMLVTCDMRLA